MCVGGGGGGLQWLAADFKAIGNISWLGII